MMIYNYFCLIPFYSTFHSPGLSETWEFSSLMMFLPSKPFRACQWHSLNLAVCVKCVGCARGLSPVSGYAFHFPDLSSQQTSPLSSFQATRKELEAMKVLKLIKRDGDRGGSRRAVFRGDAERVRDVIGIENKMLRSHGHWSQGKNEVWFTWRWCRRLRNYEEEKFAEGP